MFSETELEIMAIDIIYNYYYGKYTKSYIATNFTTAIKLLKTKADRLYNSSMAGVSSISEGNQSISYKEGYTSTLSITDDIKQFLPRRANLYAW